MSANAAATHRVTATPGWALGSLSQQTALRVALLLGCFVSLVLAGWLGNRQQYLAADPELARLLRGMAILKGLFVLVGVVLLAWRFGRPLSTRIAGLFLAEVWLAACASMLIWQLTWIPYAAAAFHVAELSFLVTAWRDWGSRVDNDMRHTPYLAPRGASRVP